MSGRRETVVVALLRAVNVGGRNRVPMDALRRLVESAGHRDARTYAQSGNVVFVAACAVVEGVAGALAQAIERELGVRTTVVVRTRAELTDVQARNPFPAETDGTKLHVLLSDGRATPDAVARLDPSRSPGDRAHVDGREVFLHLPNGAGQTRLTIDYLERALAVRGTARNWNTVTRLIELADAVAASAGLGALGD